MYYIYCKFSLFRHDLKIILIVMLVKKVFKQSSHSKIAFEKLSIIFVMTFPTRART